MIKRNAAGKLIRSKKLTKNGGVFYGGKILNVGHQETLGHKGVIEDIVITHIEGHLVDLCPMADSDCDFRACVSSHIGNEIKFAKKGDKKAIGFLNDIVVKF